MIDDEKNEAEDDDEFEDDYFGDITAGDNPDDEALVDDLMNDLGSVSLCYIHLFFSTTAQQPLFDDAALQSEVQHELSRVCKRLCCPEQGIAVGIDHVHVVCRVHPELSIDDLVKRLKGDTQEWLLRNTPELGPTIWQESYGGCSVGGEEMGELRRYLEEEPQRHTIESYEDEFRRLCAENGIEIEEPDCWQ